MAKKTAIKYENFDLISFKIADKGVNVIHFENGSALPGNDEKKGEVLPHPDLQDALDELAIMVADKMGLLEGFNLALGMASKATHKGALKQGSAEAVGRIKVNGLSYDGEGELAGVNVKFYLKFPKVGGTGLASGKIHFNASALGYEAEVEEIAEKIKREVFEYRFNNKKLQLDIETEAEKSPELALD